MLHGEARKFDISNDYDTISKWWRAHGSYAPLPEHLPPNGIVVEKENQPVCAGFLYNTDAKICVIEFLVCDPSADKETRNEALDYLIKILRDMSVEMGYTAIYNSTGIPKFISRLKKAGFVEADKNQAHMFYFAYETIEGKENE